MVSYGGGSGGWGAYQAACHPDGLCSLTDGAPRSLAVANNNRSIISHFPCPSLCSLLGPRSAGAIHRKSDSEGEPRYTYSASQHLPPTGATTVVQRNWRTQPYTPAAQSQWSLLQFHPSLQLQDMTRLGSNSHWHPLQTNYSYIWEAYTMSMMMIMIITMIMIMKKMVMMINMMMTMMMIDRWRAWVRRWQQHYSLTLDMMWGADPSDSTHDDDDNHHHLQDYDHHHNHDQIIIIKMTLIWGAVPSDSTDDDDDDNNHLHDDHQHYDDHMVKMITMMIDHSPICGACLYLRGEMFRRPPHNTLFAPLLQIHQSM